ncbi:hypothetical protein BKA70DRAFT_780040 [Coprinopsis sp. MPI-PUGE-AT-0042]|nr:hypothetical protein BKA70DRAFT_780040 [Coprinopsis sp. MPI-PUGE-AT-0042]
MSTVVATATVAETAAPSPSQRPERGGNNTNLYLVTFVATLFLLLFVSCGIVLRSYILRRRYQRQINFALANGAVITPRTPGSRRKRLGVRPRLYETWIAPLYGDTDGTLKDVPSSPDVSEKLMPEMEDNPKSSGLPQGRWCDMLPLTVQTVVVKRRIREFGIPPPPPTTSAIGVGSNPPDSPPAALPPPSLANPTATRPNLSIVTPPSNQPTSSWSTSTLRSLQSQVQFAEQPRGDGVPLPSVPENPVPRSNRNSILAILTPGTATPETPTIPPPPLRERRSSTGSVLATRERRESSTWRTIVSPNPSLPVPPLPTAVSAEDEDWANDENEGPRSDARSGFGRWNPFASRRNATNEPFEMTGTSATGKKCSRSTSKNRVRTEMLQISVLVEMPSVKTSRLYGAEAKSPVVPNGLEGGSGGIAHLLPRSNPDLADVVEEALSDDESDSDSEDGDQEPEPLPDLVLGITRLPFYPNARKGDVAIATCPSSPPVAKR